MTFTPSECAKLGSQRSREASAKFKHENIEKYLDNPKLCKKCGTIIPYDKRRNDFCKMSCAASVRNKGIRRHGNPELRKIKRDLYLKSDRCKIMKNKAQTKRHKLKREVLLSCFGKSCKLCNFDKRITVHEKNGDKHKDFNDMSWEEINNIIINEKDKYISVCYRCHNHVHWCMKMLGMSWDSICQLSGLNLIHRAHYQKP